MVVRRATSNNGGSGASVGETGCANIVWAYLLKLLLQKVDNQLSNRSEKFFHRIQQ